jgi:NAD(P)H-hydrate epimerase
MNNMQPLTRESLAGLIPRRPRDAHKGLFGHVLIVGGQPGMLGAVRLAGEAAYRCGAGLVSVATHPEHASLVSIACPELMTHGVGDGAALHAAAQRATVIALGPGLGTGKWSEMLFHATLDLARPMVVDADGLNLLARAPARREDWVLTPHAGEAARLLGVSAGEIQSDRSRAVRGIADRFGGTCVLKGAGTLVAKAGDGAVWRCDAGNPGMASGGMGDVLTGVIAALMAQRLAPFDAARAAVWAHATAGDRCAARIGEAGFLASEVCAALPEVLREIGS